MAAAGSAITFDVADCKIAAVNADASGGATTYHSSVDVPGITEVSLEPNFITNELKGDGGVVLAKKGKIDRLNFSCTYGELSIDVLDVLLGDTKAAAGSGTAETLTLGMTDASLPYFRIQFLINDLQTSGDSLAEVIVTLQKAQLTGGTLVSGSTDAFNQPTFTAEAIKPAGTPVQFGQIQFLETATGLTA